MPNLARICLAVDARELLALQCCSHIVPGFRMFRIQPDFFPSCDTRTHALNSGTINFILHLIPCSSPGFFLLLFFSSSIFLTHQAPLEIHVALIYQLIEYLKVDFPICGQFDCLWR